MFLLGCRATADRQCGPGRKSLVNEADISAESSKVSAIKRHCSPCSNISKSVCGWSGAVSKELSQVPAAQRGDTGLGILLTAFPHAWLLVTCSCSIIFGHENGTHHSLPPSCFPGFPAHELGIVGPQKTGHTTPWCGMSKSAGYADSGMMICSFLVDLRRGYCIAMDKALFDSEQVTADDDEEVTRQASDMHRTGHVRLPGNSGPFSTGKHHQNSYFPGSANTPHPPDRLRRPCCIKANVTGPSSRARPAGLSTRRAFMVDFMGALIIEARWNLWGGRASEYAR